MLLLFAIQTTQAQAHNMGSNYNCKLQKKGYFFNSEKHPCPACAAKDKKEKDAKIAEDKRRFAAAQAEAEAKKAASEKVRLAKLAETEKNAESGKVYINGNKNTVSTNNTIPKNSKSAIIVKNATNNTIMIATGPVGKLPNAFKNEKGEIILENKDWETESLIYNSMTTDSPKNLGIVRFSNHSRGYGMTFDLVNSKGEYLFNDPEISQIQHIKDSWLLITRSYDYKNCFLYNINTGKKIFIGNYYIYVNRYDANGFDVFTPIYSNSVELNSNSRFENQRYLTKMLRENLINWSSDIINEDMLSKYSFVLRVTNSYDNKYYGKKERYDESKTVLLCVTKNGELEVINLK